MGTVRVDRLGARSKADGASESVATHARIFVQNSELEIGGESHMNGGSYGR